MKNPNLSPTNPANSTHFSLTIFDDTLRAHATTLNHRNHHLTPELTFRCTFDRSSRRTSPKSTILPDGSILKEPRIAIKSSGYPSEYNQKTASRVSNRGTTISFLGLKRTPPAPSARVVPSPPAPDPTIPASQRRADFICP